MPRVIRGARIRSSSRTVLRMTVGFPRVAEAAVARTPRRRVRKRAAAAPGAGAAGGRPALRLRQRNQFRGDSRGSDRHRTFLLCLDTVRLPLSDYPFPTTAARDIIVAVKLI